MNMTPSRLGLCHLHRKSMRCVMNSLDPSVCFMQAKRLDVQPVSVFGSWSQNMSSWTARSWLAETVPVNVKNTLNLSVGENVRDEL